MTKTKAKKKIVIRSIEEIPSFESEDMEREWWATHDMSEELYNKLERAAPELKAILNTQRPGDRQRRT